ncbi:MAG: IS200/IS605 family transposase [Lachnospiraceae bacterium]|nr:IS200/IS605 family transposase [Lachnospiraceae bacterium]
MSMKMVGSFPGYQNYYHLVRSTKYRKSLFVNLDVRNRLRDVLMEISEQMEGLKIDEVTVAYNHVHLLIKTELPLDKVAKKLYGVSSRLLRKEFPFLKEESVEALWGGRECISIKDRDHLLNCRSYIQRHQPDNTKVDGPL